MINQEIEKLREELENQNNSYRQINIETFLHFSCDNQKFQKLVSKFGVKDINVFKNNILNILINKQPEPNAQANNQIPQQRPQNGPVDYNDQNALLAQIAQNPNREREILEPQDLPEIDPLFNAVYEKAQRLTANPNATDDEVAETDPTYYTFLKALFEVSEETNNPLYVNFLAKRGLNFQLLLQGENALIESVCSNLNEWAEQLEETEALDVLGRDKEIVEISRALGKLKKSSVALLGEMGVGKTKIVEGLALKLVNDENLPSTVANSVIFMLKNAPIENASMQQNDLEMRAKIIMDEFKDQKEDGKDPILFIDDISDLGGSGLSSSASFLDILKPYILSGELRCIGACTQSQWTSITSENKKLGVRFHKVKVKETTQEETVEILKNLKHIFEAKHDLEYTDQALERCVELSAEFLKNEKFPEKAIDLLDYSGSMHKINMKETVGLSEMEESIAEKKSISIERVRNNVTAKNKKKVSLAKQIKNKVFGQDEHIDKIVEIIEISQAGLKEENKPVGSFLLLGSTGVGKTETAIQISKALDTHLERIDMSELMERHSVSKLIGTSAGYIGYGDEPRLSKVLSENPHCVLLLDEIEKAHPDVQKLFLQAMDNGCITDSKNNKLSFENVIILMTSNAGANELKSRSIGIGRDQRADSVDKALGSIKNQFLPEFLGRLNETVMYNNLSKDSLLKVVDRSIAEINAMPGLKKKNISIDLSKKAKNYILDNSDYQNYGGRNVKKVVNDLIKVKLSKEILYGDALKENSTVKVDVKKGVIDFNFTEND